MAHYVQYYIYCPYRPLSIGISCNPIGTGRKVMDGQEIKLILGRNIKIIRTHRHFSQAILAEKVDISINYLSKIERGIMYPKAEILAQIAEGFGVEAYELFKNNNETGPLSIFKVFVRDIFRGITNHMDNT